MTAAEGFNLLDEPWIVVLHRDGRQQQVSILELLSNAQQFTTIGGEVPTQAFAITRLLLAFLHRALAGPATRDDWAGLWEADNLPSDRFASYADKLRDRFDLFDPDKPFMQVAELRTKKNEVFGLERIVADVPNGEPLFTTRSARDLQKISAAEAARWLVHAHAFDTSGIKSGAVGDPSVKGGKGYPIGPGWSGQLGGVLLQGNDLRETLLLNLIGCDAASYVTIGGDTDVPAWEREPDGPEGKQRPPRGAIDLYTWQTRRVRLFGDRYGVTGVLLANGDKIAPQNLHSLEPHSGWRLSDTQSKILKSTVYMPRLHDPNRSVWRGIAALLPSTAGRHSAGGQPQPFLAPGALQWVSDLVAQGVLPENYKPRMRVYGVLYGPQKATFAEIVEDELPLPLVVLREDRPAAGKTASEAVSDAECAAKEIWRFAQNIASAAGSDPESKASGDAAREDFYALLEAPYRRWIATLRPQTSLNEARVQWRSAVRDAARSVADQLITDASPAAWAGRDLRGRLVNVALAEAWFRAGLRRCLPKPSDPAAKSSEESR